MRLVLDTNIYLASLLANGLCLKIVELVMDKNSEHQVFISEEILTELKNTIINKKLISISRLPIVEEGLRQRALWVDIVENINADIRDSDDNKILECAVACKADLVITMDKDLLSLKTFRNTGIIHPKTFLHIVGK
jgi:putative PIN family toxin of toxin-antitoxin system